MDTTPAETCPKCHNSQDNPAQMGRTTGDYVVLCPHPFHGTGMNDATPDSFEQELDYALIQYEQGYVEAVNDDYNGGKAHANDEAVKARILAAHRESLRAELQALASSNNWRVQLEDRLEQLK